MTEQLKRHKLNIKVIMSLCVIQLELENFHKSHGLGQMRIFYGHGLVLFRKPYGLWSTGCQSEIYMHKWFVRANYGLLDFSHDFRKNMHTYSRAEF